MVARRSERLDDDFLFFDEASKQAKMGRMGNIITNRTKQNCAFGPSLGRMFFFFFSCLLGCLAGSLSFSSDFLFHSSRASDSGIAGTTRMAAAACRCTHI
jgi:hypothetical protein